MIQYLNYLAPILLSIMAMLAGILVKGHLDMDRICKKYEPLKDRLLLFSKLWNCYNDIKENIKKLEEKMKLLQSREQDVKTAVKDQEQQTGRQQKQETNNWLKNAERIGKEMDKILEKEKRTLLLRILYRISLRNCVKKSIQEIDRHLESGSSLPQRGLLSQTTQKTSLVTTDLVGEAASNCIERILKWLKNDREPKIIAVLGGEGVGKTAVVQAVHNQLIESNVYTVYISGENLNNELQIAIAKAVMDRDIGDEDEMKRPAMLYETLKRKNHFMLILDGLSQYFDPPNVGIPIYLNGGIDQPSQGKLIITTRSEDVCRRMCCWEPFGWEAFLILRLNDYLMKCLVLQTCHGIKKSKFLSEA